MFEYLIHFLSVFQYSPALADDVLQFYRNMLLQKRSLGILPHRCISGCKLDQEEYYGPGYLSSIVSET